MTNKPALRARTTSQLMAHVPFLDHDDDPIVGVSVDYFVDDERSTPPFVATIKTHGGHIYDGWGQDADVALSFAIANMVRRMPAEDTNG